MDVEVVFLGDAPGQGGVIKIGKTVYERGKTYHNVPEKHFAKGGFYILSTSDGVVMVRGRPVRRAVVLGTAPSMWDDLAAADELMTGMEWEVIAVNEAGILYEKPFALWFSIHGFKLVKWVRKRGELGLDMNFKAYGNFADPEKSEDVIRWNHPNGGGSSGLFAVLGALELGYDQLILCGVTMDGKKKHDPTAGQLIDATCPYDSYRPGWYKVQAQIKDKVRSMSGWTAEFLGKPTREWLYAAADDRVTQEISTDSGADGYRAGDHTPGVAGPSPAAATNKRRKKGAAV